MGLSFFLILAGYSGDVERMIQPWAPWILATHPIGVLLFFAWFLHWNHLETLPPTLEKTAGPVVACASLPHPTTS